MSDVVGDLTNDRLDDSIQTANEVSVATQEPVEEPNVSETNSPDTVIVIKRSTLYYGIAALIFVVAAYVIGFNMGAASRAGTNQVVQEAIATSVAALYANNPGNAAAQPTEDPNLRYTVDVAGSPALGPANAPVTIVEFSDFQCPFCGNFFRETETALLKQYDGKIRLVYRNFPLEEIHPYALGAAEAAQCANDQGKFWEYHDLLFQNQQQLTKTDFIAYAKQLNLDMTTFQSCIDGNKDDAKIQNDLQAGANLNVNGTPTFFINGRKLIGSQPLTAFVAYIDAELASPSPTATSNQ